MIAPASRPSAASFGVPPRELVEQALADQQSLTAIDRFSARHDVGDIPAQGLYTDLIPLREPGPGEQYAFEVDLDRCTGCKACVTACHSLNGLDEDETWRSVGLLQKVATSGATSAASPVIESAQQHVTTACHHCADPGCAQGCPTLAYEKDPATGVVRHLDDQCFGCQYCVLKCPYDVPQYNAKRGIVRKCDLCIGRLREGEAPACAQACPTQAIRVTLVETDAVRRAPDATFDLPGAPDPSRVAPTTRYRSARGLAEGLTAADAAQVRPEHAHAPLVFMLVISQAAAGYWTLLAGEKLARLTAGASGSTGSIESMGTAFPGAEVAGFAGVQLFLLLSLLHLGRPLLAWKAVLGWRRSWLSREVIAFSALAGATATWTLMTLLSWATSLPTSGIIRRTLEGMGGVLASAPLRLVILIAVLGSVAAALYASAMVYRDTPRLLWATRATLWRFVLTALLCGIPAWLLAAGSASSSSFLLLAVPPLQILKLLLEASLMRHRDDEDFNPLWKGAQLLFGALRPVWIARVTLGLLGGIALPIAFFAGGLSGPVWFAWSLVMITAGELIERHLFFTTAVAPRMPGGRK